MSVGIATLRAMNMGCVSTMYTGTLALWQLSLGKHRAFILLEVSTIPLSHRLDSKLPVVPVAYTASAKWEHLAAG